MALLSLWVNGGKSSLMDLINVSVKAGVATEGPEGG